MIMINKKKGLKVASVDGYNRLCDLNTGFSARWGNTKDEDPNWSPLGPEIADIEISTVCHGIGKPCSWCYKSNTEEGINMNLETFKKIFSLFPKNLDQIAFGIGDINANPDLWKIMEHCRNNDVVPNITINGWNMTDEDVANFKKYCGAIAVSRYSNDLCYNTVKRLTDAGLTQVNIHQLLSEQTYDACLSFYDDVKNDPRLEKLKAIVFLDLKPKGKRNVFTNIVEFDKYVTLLKTAIEKEINIGFDSCFAPIFNAVIKKLNKDGIIDEETLKKYDNLSEPCESTLFSFYVNAEGKYFPCSFCEDEEGIESIDLLTVTDFMKEVWNSEKIKKFRDTLLDTEKKYGCRRCPKFKIYECLK